MSMKKTKLLVSACLLGERCRYDGRSKPDQAVIDLGEKYEIFAVCPECDGGLVTPRAPSERVGEHVINSLGADVSDNFCKGANAALELCRREGIRLAVLKENSPSCGRHFIYDGSFGGVLVAGMGVTAQLLCENGISVYSENETEILTKENE